MHQALSVSAVTTYLRELLESHPLLGDLWVQGEVAEFKRHAASGHCYFSLKDEGGLVRAVMWRSNAVRLSQLPRMGDLVLAHGYLSLYAPRGELQLYADTLLPAGVGLLYARFEALRARLEAEGLFAIERKRPLPRLPRRIGLVTAPGGAALQDMLTILARRCPLSEVLVAPCLVQGERAPASIVAALTTVYAAGVDLVILARGGGSLEDLWAFNDEAVARAVFASPVPLITGVGHETDTTMVDYVADLRAPTPSAAAELAVPEHDDLSALVWQSRMRLDQSVDALLNRTQADLANARSTIDRHTPLRRLARDRQQVDDLGRHLDRAVDRTTAMRQLALQGLVARLATLSPQATLQRGYAVVRHATTGHVLGSVIGVPSGTPLQIDLRDGTLAAVTVPLAEEESE
ncbi:exodeoxyribonuclease VII large subunit [Candidatus Chloroploca sp. M-50]|uniref:Exodeoxyribonuclease 7 large subunit n=1 Tax=Candidatus Chloroploca mongolica TaxID=2528176 RepID=A0ABS4D7M1_9CHLR|nr:exodeoxyribonuclease VII large subunit [Candidatus Chloroploca mongolica]MBP1465434.1 exodeoxyribonuclease VII large subunit [Candidatus Chloroploca mongolica]